MIVSSQELPRNAKDRVQKVLAAALGEVLPQWYDPALPRVVSVLPAHVPLLHVQENLLDSVFLTEDGYILHLEFQSSVEPNLLRFAHYALALIQAHQRPVRTVVIYLGAVTTAPDTADYGSVSLRVRNIFIAARSAETTMARLQIRPVDEWTVFDDLDLAFLPFMHHPRLSQQDLVVESVTLLDRAPSGHQAFIAAAIFGLTGNFLEEPVIQSLKEVIRMRNLLKEFEDEATARGLEQGIRQGIEQGVQRGIEQGIQQGIRQGTEQGIQHGVAESVVAVLTARFGLLDAAPWMPKLSAADPDRLLTVVIPEIVRAENLQEVAEVIQRLLP